MNKDFTTKKKHHEQSKFSYKRPAYREAKWERAVKVYTINQESKYLLIQGVPNVGVCKELVELFAIYGAIEEYRYLDEYPAEEFTDVYWIKFQKIQSARFAKKKLDMRSFYGGVLHVCYAPEFETVDETREKLNERRHQVGKKCREYYPNQNKIRAEKGIVKEETSRETARKNVQRTFEQPIIEQHVQIQSSLNNVPCQVSVSSSQPEISTQRTSEEQSFYPQLPLPPINLPYFLYPPPPPPPPQDFPKVPTKNATLPRELQDYSNALTEPNLVSNSTISTNTTTCIKDEALNSSKRTTECMIPASGNQEHQGAKRIVWHKQPSASFPTSSTVGPAGNHLLTVPGAWDPHAEERKKLKSLTGDEHLDEVAFRIRDKLRKVTATDSVDQIVIDRETKPVKKKARKRI